MAITITGLTTDSSTASGPYTTASVSPGANRLVEVDVITLTFAFSTPPTVSLSGNSLTYVEVATVIFGDDSGSQRITRLRAMGGSPSGGAITITTSGASCIGCIWSVKEADGVDTTGTNGSGAYVQTVTNRTTGASPNSLTGTLSALSDANNATSAVFCNDGGENISPDTGYTEIHDTVIASTLGLETQWKVPGATTATISAGDFRDLGVIISEIKAASGGAAAPPKRLLLLGVGCG